MRIAHIGLGSSTHIQRLAGFQAERGHPVFIVTAKKYGPYPEIKGVKFCVYDSYSPILFKIRQIRRILKENEIEIIHSHFVNHGGYIGLSTGFHPHLMSIWGCDVLNVPNQYLRHRIGVNTALKSADALAPVSNQLAREVERLIGKPRDMKVLSWGVDADHFKPKLTSQFRKKLGIDKETKLILSPRLLEPHYNQDVLIQAMPEILKQNPSAKLLILKPIVDEVYLEKLKTQIRNLKIEENILWYGRVEYDDLPGLFSESDVVVSIPTTDGTPQTVLESMSCGAPLVVCNVESLKEWVSDNVNGYLTNPKDPSELAERINRVLAWDKNKKSNVSISNRQKILESATRIQAIQEFEKWYQELIESQSERFSFKKTLQNYFA